MTTYPFSYEVIIVDDMWENPTTTYYCESGMGIATSFADAARIVEEYYGNDIVIIKNLELYEENKLITLPKRVIEEYSLGANAGYRCDEKGNPLKE